MPPADTTTKTGRIRGLAGMRQRNEPKNLPMDTSSLTRELADFITNRNEWRRLFQ
jgi:hypothetical protein